MDTPKKLHKALTVVTFLYAFIIYILTMAPTTSFWDCGEFIATSIILGVPHPPGTPFYLLLGNFFSQIPTFSDLGARVNLISPLFSAFSVMFLYLIIVQLIEEWRGEVKSWSDGLIIYGSAIIGAFTFAVTDSHWFNAVEAEVYSLSTFFTSIVIWLILKWSKNSGHSGNVRYILIIAYMFGLAIGIHLLNLLALPFIALIVYFNKYEPKPGTFIATIGITLGVFVVIYLGIIKGLPNMANSYGLNFPIIIIIAVFAAMIFSIWKNYYQFSTILTCLVLILIGFSTYATIFIRASQHPNINENNPDTIEGALAYMNRDQYGDWEILNPAFTLARGECSYSNRWTLNKNDPTMREQIGFLWNYQIKEMYLRYFAWQFIGKESTDEKTWKLVTLKNKLIKELRGIDWWHYGLPFPLLFGIAGMIFHFSRDWKRALAVMTLFITTGIMIILYLNQYDPQPRERDYSYVGSFFAFSIWIGIGVAALQEKIKEWLEGDDIATFVSVGITGILFITMPITMLATDFHEHNRNGNYVAWDYAYNMLNSCEPNGIIFTNGDNDTFPLWYIQEVEGVRKDVRVVNLSLLNTPWYIDQLKNEEPKIPIKIKDDLIAKLDPIIGTPYALLKWTKIWPGLERQHVEFFKQRGEEYSISDHGILSDWRGNDGRGVDAHIDDGKNSIIWKITPKISNYLRIQDIMVLQIIEDAIQTRPIYFAVTVAPNNRLGMDDYLEMEGLVYRITHEKNVKIRENECLTLKDSDPLFDQSKKERYCRQITGSQIIPRLNSKRMLQNISETNDYEMIIYGPEVYTDTNENGKWDEGEYYTDANRNNQWDSDQNYWNQINEEHGIYRYTNLNNSDVYFNETIQRLIQNYRSSFLQLGFNESSIITQVAVETDEGPTVKYAVQHEGKTVFQTINRREAIKWFLNDLEKFKTLKELKGEKSSPMNTDSICQGYEDVFLTEESCIKAGHDWIYKSKTLRLLEMMDRYFPTDVIPIIDVSLDVHIGRIYNQEGRPEELKRRLERIQERKDLKIEDEIMIGQVYFNELNDIDAFIDYYEKLHEKHPLYSEILYSLVQAYTQVERSDEARDILERWINFHPNDSQAVEWLSILNNLHN